jgi:hypothetical protein
MAKLDFEDIINSGKILICDLSKGKIGEDVSSFLGSLVVTKIQLAAFRRVHDEQKTEKTSSCILMSFRTLLLCYLHRFCLKHENTD